MLIHPSWSDYETRPVNRPDPIIMPRCRKFHAILIVTRGLTFADASEFFWIGPAAPQIDLVNVMLLDEVEADDPARNDLDAAAVGSHKIC
jgi:hypothetical protein